MCLHYRHLLFGVLLRLEDPNEEVRFFANGVIIVLNILYLDQFYLHQLFNYLLIYYYYLFNAQQSKL
jgi:hypothetical protein